MAYDKESREHQTNNLFFIHNMFGTFFNGVLNWFDHEFYPRFNYKVLGTYDKSVEFFNKKKQLGIEASSNLLPSITLDPVLDFSNAEQGGKFLWQYSRYAPSIGIRLWPSIDLKEQNILITPVYSRYQGTFEITFWLSSIYELMDFRVSLLQFCGGYNRWCRPEIFWTYLMLPEAISEYIKDDGEVIDWGDTLSDIMHIRTINKHKRVVPISLHPMWRLQSLSDSSNKYGGDNIAEYKLSASFEYEINLPTYAVVSENVDASINLNLEVGKSYTKYPLTSPYKILSSLKDNGDMSEFFSDNFIFYKFLDEQLAKDNFLVTFSDQTSMYPARFEQWCHIFSGKLVFVDDEFIEDPTNTINRTDIIVFDVYKDEYLTYLRKAGAAISFNDSSNSTFYHKCEVMRKSCVCNLSDGDQAIVNEQLNNVVTLDSKFKKLYEGALETIEVEDDRAYIFTLVNEIKDRNPDAYYEALEHVKNDSDSFLPQHRASENTGRMQKRLICEYSDGIQLNYPLSYIIDDNSLASILIYVDDELVKQNIDYIIVNNNTIQFMEAPEVGSSIYIGGEMMVIQESKLIGIYEFSQEDIDSFVDYIEVELDGEIKDKENLVVVSYPGELAYGIDYNIIFETNSIYLYIKPQLDEIVQFFYYV